MKKIILIAVLVAFFIVIVLGRYGNGMPIVFSKISSFVLSPIQMILMILLMIVGTFVKSSWLYGLILIIEAICLIVIMKLLWILGKKVLKIK